MKPNYDSLPGVRATEIKAGQRSMLHMYHARTQQTERTSAMRWGSLVHASVLEANECPVVVYDGIRRGKEWDAFSMAHDPDFIVKPDEFEALQEMRAALRQNKDAMRLLKDAQTEQVLTWTDPLLGACKVKADAINVTPNGFSLVEYKTTSKIVPAAFAFQAMQLGYDLQLGWYSHGIEAVKGKWPVNVWLIAQESKPPYDVVIYTVPNGITLPAYDRCVEIVKRYRAHETAGVFPGVADQVLTLEMPNFSRGDDVGKVPDEEGEAGEL